MEWRSGDARAAVAVRCPMSMLCNERDLTRRGTESDGNGNVWHEARAARRVQRWKSGGLQRDTESETEAHCGLSCAMSGVCAVMCVCVGVQLILSDESCAGRVWWAARTAAGPLGGT